MMWRDCTWIESQELLALSGGMCLYGVEPAKQLHVRDDDPAISLPQISVRRR